MGGPAPSTFYAGGKDNAVYRHPRHGTSQDGDRNMRFHRAWHPA